MPAKSRKRPAPRRRAQSADADALQVAYTKLFRSDIELLKQRAKDSGVPWQTVLRTVVHLALTGPRLKAFKFLIPSDRERMVAEGVAASASIALALGHSREEAQGELERFFSTWGRDSRWVRVADIAELPIDRPGVLGAMTT
jgi:hypothetical protein